MTGMWSRRRPGGEMVCHALSESGDRWPEQVSPERNVENWHMFLHMSKTKSARFGNIWKYAPHVENELPKMPETLASESSRGISGKTGGGTRAAKQRSSLLGHRAGFSGGPRNKTGAYGRKFPTGGDDSSRRVGSMGVCASSGKVRSYRMLRHAWHSRRKAPQCLGCGHHGCSAWAAVMGVVPGLRSAWCMGCGHHGCSAWDAVIVGVVPGLRSSWVQCLGYGHGCSTWAAVIMGVVPGLRSWV
eukprot:1183355-Prorocentrum_minimum.AAC.1